MKTVNQTQAAFLRAQAHAHVAALRPQLARHPVVKGTLAHFFPPKLRSDVNLNLSDFGNSVHISLTLHDLDSFKDKVLVKLLAQFGDEWSARSSDYAHGNNPNRDFNFTRRVAWTPTPNAHTRWLEKTLDQWGTPVMNVPSAFELSVGIYAYVKSDSPLCRVEVTGFKEEVVRKEIRKIVCA